MKTRRRITFAIVLLFFLAVLITQLPTAPQLPPSPAPIPTIPPAPSDVLQAITMEGISWSTMGDPTAGTSLAENQSHLAIRLFTDSATGKSFHLELTPELRIQLESLTDGSRVKIIPDSLKLPSPSESTISPMTIQTVEVSQQLSSNATQGNFASLYVPCLFQNENTPQPVEYFRQATNPSIAGSHVWYQQRIGVNANGSQVLESWVLIGEKNNYLFVDKNGQTNPKFQELMDACLKAALTSYPSLGLSSFKGINFIFSSTIGCCFWGGRGYTPSPSLNINQVFNYTLSDGGCPCWLALTTHEILHTLQVRHSGPAGIPGNVWDPMSRAEINCPDKSVFGCTAQGIPLTVLLGIGNNLPQVTYAKNVLQAKINYLYEPLANDYVYGIKIQANPTTWLSIVARQGGQGNPDNKMGGMACVTLTEVIEGGHPAPAGGEKYPDVLLNWQDGDSCGYVGDQLVWNGIAALVLDQTPNGFTVWVGSPNQLPRPTLIYLPLIGK